MKSMLDDLLDRGFARGLKKGREEGRQEGWREGLTQALLYLLQVRFGRLSKAIEKRVRAGTEAQIEQWLGAAARASSLAAVFEPS